MLASTFGRRNDISETNQDRVCGYRCVKEWSRKPASSLDLIFFVEQEVIYPLREEAGAQVKRKFGGVSRRGSEKAGKATVTFTSTDT